MYEVTITNANPIPWNDIDAITMGVDSTYAKIKYLAGQAKAPITNVFLTPRCFRESGVNTAKQTISAI